MKDKPLLFLFLWIFVFLGCGSERPLVLFQDKETKLFGYKTESGKIRIKPQFADAENFVDGSARVRLADSDLYGLISSQGKMRTAFEFEEIGDFHSKRAKFSKVVNGVRQFGYIAIDGAIAIAPKFYYASDFVNSSATVQIDSGKSVLIGLAGDIVGETNYFFVGQEVDDRIPVVEWKNFKFGKFGYLDSNLAIAMPFEFSAVREFSDGYAVVSCGMKFGLINTFGKFVAPCIFLRMSNFENGRSYVETQDKKGFVNSLGVFTEVIPVVPHN